MLRHMFTVPESGRFRRGLAKFIFAGPFSSVGHGVWQTKRRNKKVQYVKHVKLSKLFHYITDYGMAVGKRHTHPHTHHWHTAAVRIKCACSPFARLKLCRVWSFPIDWSSNDGVKITDSRGLERCRGSVYWLVCPSMGSRSRKSWWWSSSCVSTIWLCWSLIPTRRPVRIWARVRCVIPPFAVVGGFVKSL